VRPRSRPRTAASTVSEFFTSASMSAL
jgi:hypothetical protein